jgi:F0F1-type ATP synthase assembly protein I
MLIRAVRRNEDGMSEHSRHGHHGQHGHSGGGNPLKTSAQATLHCLSGCVIGEFAGLVIGTVAGLTPWPMIVLATALSYLSGITLGLLPVMRDRHVGLLAALKIIWVGEVVSIGVMEIVMNFVDYQLGGMGAKSIFVWTFWRGLVFAVPAGFLAAWPVNWWLLKRELKACH